MSVPPFNHHALLVLGIACVLLARRQLPLLVFFTIAFLSGPLLFTNLYYVHNYYLTATGVWLLLGISAAVMGVADMGATRRWPRLAAILVTAVVGSAGFFSWSTSYAVVLRAFPSYEQLLEGWTLPIQRTVPSPRTVLVLGDEWNPVWLYYAQRKGICWPEKTLEGFPGSRMEESLAMLGPEERLGAVVCMNQLLATEKKETIEKILRDFRMSPDGIATAIGVIFPAEDLIPQQAE